MKLKFLLSLLILLVLLPTVFADCSSLMNIEIEVESLTSNWEISPYPFPSFRENDVLALKKLNVTNIGTCELEKPYIKINLKNGEYIVETPFSLGSSYHIPVNLSAGESYWLERVSDNIYNDSENTITLYGFVILNTLGKWDVSVETSYYRKEMQIYNPIGGSLIVNGIHLNEVGFRVYSDLDLGQRDAAQAANSLAKNGIYIAFASVIIALASIFVTYCLTKQQITHAEAQLEKQFRADKERKEERQKNLLKSLSFEVGIINEDSKSYQDTFNASSIPLFPIKIIDAHFYSKNLNPTIGKENTKALKEQIFIVYDKAILMNSYLKWLHEGEFNPLYDPSFSSGYRKPDIKNYSQELRKTFYPKLQGAKKDLDKAITEVKKILEKEFNTKI